ncbi:alpha/beta fold hydrolase [Brevundimonas sp.]|uniref:alpha/beta fold hydrolase n=1 Tax=Brevundimonas sp. TaxID=1871086 RepID=UPI002FC88358
MAIVLVCGFMADETLWDDMLDALAPYGPVIPLALREGETIEAMAQALLPVLPAHFHLAGFSMGGYVAREIVRRVPDRVQSLILIATSARGDTDEMIRQRRSALKSPPERFRGLSRSAIQSSLHPDLRDDADMLARVRDMGLNLGGHVFHRQSFIARDGDLDRLSDITVPTLIVAADTDDLRSPAEARELVDGITGASLVTIPHSGHMIPLEQPEALAHAMTDWLQQF